MLNNIVSVEVITIFPISGTRIVAIVTTTGTYIRIYNKIEWDAIESLASLDKQI